MESPIKLIAGLGNPGPQYLHTRHNAGADFVRQLASELNQPLREESRFFAETARASIDGQDVRLLVPTTYMNLSGKAIAALANFYQIEAESILVAHDELDLPPGTARFKQGGGHGGHNGLRDIIQCLGNNRNFARLRIGIGHPGDSSQVTNYVLSKASPADQALIADSMEDAIKALPKAIGGHWQQAMTALHTN